MSCDKFVVISQEMKCFTEVVSLKVAFNILGCSYAYNNFVSKLQIHTACFEHSFI